MFKNFRISLLLDQRFQLLHIGIFDIFHTFAFRGNEREILLHVTIGAGTTRRRYTNPVVHTRFSLSERKKNKKQQHRQNASRRCFRFQLLKIAFSDRTELFLFHPFYLGWILNLNGDREMTLLLRL